MANKPGWSKPSTILFASEIPANELAFEYALLQAEEQAADLILFHAYDPSAGLASEASGVRYNDYAAAARAAIKDLQPLADRVRRAGIRCELVVRPGLPADEILSYAREREIDRIVMGSHSPRPIGKVLVGSVAEEVLRNAQVPIYILGPEVADMARRKLDTRTVLCAVSFIDSSSKVATFAAEVAARHHARLILQHVIRPQDRVEVLRGRSIEEVEAELLNLIPNEVREQISIQSIVVPGDPAEELLYQCRAQQADLIILGAHGASAFAAISRHGLVYKILAHSDRPVITLSPVLLAEGVKYAKEHQTETFLAGVF